MEDGGTMGLDVAVSLQVSKITYYLYLLFVVIIMPSLPKKPLV